MEAWPAILPLPLRADNSRAPADLSVRSVLAGPTVARQRATRTHETCPVSFVMTDLQLAVFDAWWHITACQGCRWFMIALAGETGLESHTARLSDGYTATSQGGQHWAVTATLEIDAQPQLTAAQYAALGLS